MFGIKTYIKSLFDIELRQKKKFFKQFISKDDLVFDIGANKGEMSALFLKLGASVIAVEPQKKCIDILESKLKGNSHFTSVHAGLSDFIGRDKISICDDGDELSTMDEKWKTKGRFAKHNWSRSEEIDIITLDSLIEKHGMPSFCKIDVEGLEVKVLKGLSKAIPLLSFEFTKEFFDDAIACLERLDSLGKIEVNFSLAREYKLHYEHWTNKDKLIENLSSINDKMLCGDIYVKKL